ncbi:hypothetical protein ACFSR9_09035 [Deinococcus taklimakanensis]|uniref:Prepilin-type N-terminal cleavage/methylation domain-containing protein n=1 Tax=Deinococcus taklimakanensis TaxID=536443 RepID=A0ABW5P2Q3_9DEIO
MQGLTLLEVLAALGILVIVSAVIATVFLSSLSGNSGARKRTYASQLLNGTAARVTQHVLTVPTETTTYLAFNASSSSTPVSEIPTDCATYLSSNPSHYCVSASNDGTFNPSVGGTALLTSAQEVYSLQVCWQESGVKCVATKALY